MAIWIGFGEPLKVVNADNIGWVELRDNDATIHMLDGQTIDVADEHVGQLVQGLQHAGAKGLSSTRWRRMDPGAEGGRA